MRFHSVYLIARREFVAFMRLGVSGRNMFHDNPVTK